MALDEPRDNDEIIQEDGIIFMIEKQLYNDVKPIHVDFVETAMGAGFSISSNLKQEGGCGTSCSC